MPCEINFFQRYCYACWKKHVNDDLKEELDNISDDLETSAARFEERIIYFRVNSCNSLLSLLEFLVNSFV